MTRAERLELMAYADGELDGDDLRRVEARLERDAEAARFVAALAPLGDLVRQGHEDKLEEMLGELDLTDAIMARVDASKGRGADADPVEEGAAARAPKVRSLDAARSRRNTILGAAAAALALAASVVVFSRPKEAEQPLAQQTAQPALTQARATGEPAEVAATTSGGVEVEAVESAGSSVSVFYFPTANELSTSVVVWVDETGEK